MKSIQRGQVWRKDDDGQDYLVTKVYSEVFSQYAVLLGRGNRSRCPHRAGESGEGRGGRVPARFHLYPGRLILKYQNRRCLQRLSVSQRRSKLRLYRFDSRFLP